MKEPLVPVVAREKLSKTPSWIMVGFVAGILFVLGVQSEWKQASPVEPPRIEASAPLAARNIASLEDRPSLAAIEALFEQYQAAAVWEDGTTELALWNSVTGNYDDFFEVRRDGDRDYYRSLIKLTRPLINDEAGSDALLKFTEPESHRKARASALLGPTFMPALPVAPRPGVLWPDEGN